MPTRRSSATDELHQQRYFSAPEFVEQQPLNGVAVCRRADLLDSPIKRRLVWYVQRKSMDPGLMEFSRQLLVTHPHRVGTKTMRRHKVKPSGVYDRNLFFRIQIDLAGDHLDQGLIMEKWATALWEAHHQKPIDQDRLDRLTAHHIVQTLESKGTGQAVTGQELIDLCLKEAKGLPRYLAEICLAPNIIIQLPGEDDSVVENYRQTIREKAAGGPELFRVVGRRYIDDLAGLLLEHMDRQAAETRDAFALTSIGEIVWSELDRCLKTSRPVIIKGETGIGKSENVLAWCRLHEGQCVRVVLRKGVNRTNFFAGLAAALGIGSALTRSTSKLELRVCEILQRRHLMLILEEFHYAFPSCKRPTATPDLPDWIYSALIDQGVAVALVATPQINQLVRDAEDKTGWNAWQWKRRVRRWIDLPAEPTRDDLEKVARKLLPEANAAMLKAVVGFAGRVTEQFDALCDLVSEARFAADVAGRETVIAKDILAAVAEVESIYKSKSSSRPVKVARAVQPRQDDGATHPRDTGADADDEPGGIPAVVRPKYGSPTAAARHERFSLVAGHK